MNKKILILCIIFISTHSQAGSYITSKHEFKSKDSDYSKTVNQIRIGYDKKVDN